MTASACPGRRGSCGRTKGAGCARADRHAAPCAVALDHRAPHAEDRRPGPEGLPLADIVVVTYVPHDDDARPAEHDAARRPGDERVDDRAEKRRPEPADR